MLFDYDITIPAGTPQNTAVIQRARLTRGKLTQVRVIFPPGPATLVHVSILHELHQLVPANPDGSLNFDDTAVTSKIDYDLLDSPYDVIITGWSPETLYDHIITCQFDVEPLEGDTWDNFNEILFSLNSRRRAE